MASFKKSGAKKVLGTQARPVTKTGPKHLPKGHPKAVDVGKHVHSAVTRQQ
jgi:hypothetical protein